MVSNLIWDKVGIGCPIFLSVFCGFGKKVSDYYQLEKLSPGYRVYFGKDDYIDIADDPEKIIETFERIESGSGKHLRKFMEESRKNYEIAMQDLVYNPGKSLIGINEFRNCQKTQSFCAKHF